VPKMADYFKLCNIAKSDAAVLDQIGEHLDPKLVGSWIGVWGGKVTTGWHIWDPHPWPAIEQMFGTHEAKYQLKKFVEDNKIGRITRLPQSIGYSPYSEIEVAMPGATVDDQLTVLSQAFSDFTGGPLSPALLDRLRSTTHPQFGLNVRIRGGQVTRVGALAPGLALDSIVALCKDAKVGVDDKLGKVVGALGEGISHVEYGRAGDRAGVDIYLEPGDSAPKMPGAKSATGDTN